MDRILVGPRFLEKFKVHAMMGHVCFSRLIAYTANPGVLGQVHCNIIDANSISIRQVDEHDDTKAGMSGRTHCVSVPAN